MKRITLFWVAGLVLAVSSSLPAAEKNGSGAHGGSHGSGTHDQSGKKAAGQSEKTTTWQNEKGQGTRTRKRSWNKESKTGTYSSETVRPDGTTTSRSGTVQKNADGSVTQAGTITGPDGKTTQVDKTSVKNEDGSRDVHSTHTNEAGETLNVDKTVVKTEDGREVTGTYESSTGKSGTFNSKTTVQDGTVVTETSRTNQDGKTSKRRAETKQTGDGATRTVTNTNPQGKEHTRTGTVEKGR